MTSPRRKDDDTNSRFGRMTTPRRTGRRPHRRDDRKTTPTAKVPCFGKALIQEAKCEVCITDQSSHSGSDSNDDDPQRSPVGDSDDDDPQRLPVVHMDGSRDDEEHTRNVLYNTRLRVREREEQVEERERVTQRVAALSALGGVTAPSDNSPGGRPLVTKVTFAAESMKSVVFDLGISVRPKHYACASTPMASATCKQCILCAAGTEPSDGNS